MESSQSKLNIKSGSKRKGSNDEEAEIKRKIPRSFVQICNDKTEYGLGERDYSAENDLSSTENKTQNSNQSCVLYLRNIKNESNKFECKPKRPEDDEWGNSAETDLISNVNKTWDNDQPNSQKLRNNKTEPNKDEGSKRKPGFEEQHVEGDSKANSVDGYASLEVEKRKFELIQTVNENIIESSVETSVSSVEEHDTGRVDGQGFEVANTDENSEETSKVVDKEKEVEQKPDKYVYRILRFNERYHKGLHPKDINSKISIQQHVAKGSKGQASRYISCCKSMSGIRKLGGLTNMSHRIRKVVRINITKLNKRAKVIDLTREKVRKRYIDRRSDAWEYAENFEEVIIDPTSHVPPECVEKIGEIHERSFRHT